MVTKVKEAVAGTTRLRSAHDKLTRSVKNPTAKKNNAASMSGFSIAALMTASTPFVRRSRPRSPTCFMARASRMSPTVVDSTMITIVDHV